MGEVVALAPRGVPPRVPDGGGGGVPLFAQHGARGQQVLRKESEVLLDAVEHRAPSRVDAEEVDGGLERGDVLGAALAREPVLCNRDDHLGLLLEWQHQWTYGRQHARRRERCRGRRVRERRGEGGWGVDPDTGPASAPSCVRLIFIALPATCRGVQARASGRRVKGRTRSWMAEGMAEGRVC